MSNKKKEKGYFYFLVKINPVTPFKFGFFKKYCASILFRLAQKIDKKISYISIEFESSHRLSQEEHEACLISGYEAMLSMGRLVMIEKSAEQVLIQSHPILYSDLSPDDIKKITSR